MGEYFTNKKGSYLAKAGTGNDWRYVRRSECIKWLPFDGGYGTNIKAGINSGKLIYRFPWPDEDEGNANNPKPDKRCLLNFEAIAKRNMFRSYSFRCNLSDIPHQERYIPISVIDELAPHINIFVQCPASENLPYRIGSSCNPVPSYIGIVGERYEGDTVNNPNAISYTIFRCCWCDQWFTVEPDQIEQIRASIIAMNPHEQWWHLVADRVCPKI